MVDKKHLNRIRGVLSAKNGAEIPKFQQGAKFAMYNGRQMIYSSDQSSWFNDEALTSAYTGNLGGFKSIQYDPKTPKNPLKPSPHLQTAIPGDPQITPTTAVETAADTQEKVRLTQQEYEAGKRYETLQVSQEAKAQAMSALNKPPTLDTNLLQQDINKSISETTAGINLEKAKKLQSQAKWTNAIGQGSAALINGVGQVFAAKQQATDSNLTKTTDTAYSGIAEAAKSMGPIGQAVGSIMGIAKGAGDLIQELGGGTDQQTTTDKWMDSALFSWNIGMVNGFFGKEADKFGVDKATLEAVGSSYGDTTKDLLDAAAKSEKKYGLFSSGERKRANAAARNAAVKQNRMGDIANTATDQRLAAQSMGEQAGLAYSMMTSGGYDQKYTYAAKQGGSLEWNPVITLDWEPQVELNWELPVFKEGGNIDINEELEWIPELQSCNKIRTIEELIEYAKKQNPRFIQRLSEEPRGIKFTDDEGKEAEGSHYLESMGEYVIPRIQEVDGELQFFNPQDALNKAIETGNYLKLDPEEAIIFAKQYKQGWPDFFKKFKEGGSLGDSDIPEIEETTQKNVIPEGALHKNKHHMEHAEGLTKKGIPVIDDDGEQQAEIEHSEIIFTLEVTKKLEEYYEIFYSDESSNKEKEQAALDAGKLLVYQILENTEDRTGLIESCKKGGSLTLKKSTDDLIEEVLEWMPTVVIIEEEVKETPKKKEEKSDKEIMKEAIKEALVELLTK